MEQSDRTIHLNRPSVALQLRDIYRLSQEIADIYYNQIFTSDIVSIENVCLAFSNILARDWKLPNTALFLRDAQGSFVEVAITTAPNLAIEDARTVASLLVDAIRRNGGVERLFSLGTSASGSGEENARCLAALSAAGLQAGVSIPIVARDDLVGMLVALSDDEVSIRAALHILRFIAPPIMIAVGNARRSIAMIEQHNRIENLLDELRLQTENLEDANLELQRVASYRSLFLARMSHELRTPLTAMLGFTEILIDQEVLTESQRSFCERIQASGRQLQSSLSQLVDLSRIEAGQKELLLQEFSLGDAVQETCGAVHHLAQRADVMIDCSQIPRKSPIVSDAGKLRQVLFNFLSFAVGRSRPGNKVEVGLERSWNRSYRVIIDDQGDEVDPGASILDLIDESGSQSNDRDGLRIGLLVSGHLLELLGGSVELERLNPSGLRVAISVPVRPTKR